MPGFQIREHRSDPSVTRLRAEGAAGGLKPEIYDTLKSDPDLLLELALCSMHHKLFDRGAFSLSDERIVTVSEQAHGGQGFDQWLLRFNGEEMRRPVNEAYLPMPRYLAWHREEVFRGGGRPAA